MPLWMSGSPLDVWQMLGTFASAIFTIGFVDQLRLTYRTRNVDGLSLMQWMVFAAASAIFAGYYTHLNQWIMVGMSLFGTACCLTLTGMILRYRDQSNRIK